MWFRVAAFENAWSHPPPARHATKLSRLGALAPALDQCACTPRNDPHMRRAHTRNPHTSVRPARLDAANVCITSLEIVLGVFAALRPKERQGMPQLHLCPTATSTCSALLHPPQEGQRCGEKCAHGHRWYRTATRDPTRLALHLLALEDERLQQCHEKTARETHRLPGCHGPQTVLGNMLVVTDRYPTLPPIRRRSQGNASGVSA